MRKLIVTVLILFSIKATASIIPVGSENNNLYYSIGGSSDFVLPPVSDTSTIRLDSDAYGA